MTTRDGLLALLEDPALSALVDRTLTATGDAPDMAPLLQAAQARGVPLRVEALRDPAIARLYQRPLVLVRPDGHVGWRSRSGPADAAETLLAAVHTIMGGSM